jgi:hypothetical protein
MPGIYHPSEGNPQTRFPGKGKSVEAIDAHTDNRLEPQADGDLIISIVGVPDALPPSFVDFA